METQLTEHMLVDLARSFSANEVDKVETQCRLRDIYPTSAVVVFLLLMVS